MMLPVNKMIKMKEVVHLIYNKTYLEEEAVLNNKGKVHLIMKILVRIKECKAAKKYKIHQILKHKEVLLMSCLILNKIQICRLVILLKHKIMIEIAIILLRVLENLMIQINMISIS